VPLSGTREKRPWRCYAGPMDELAFGCAVDFEAKCLKCRATREVLGEEPEAELILEDPSSNDDAVLVSGVVRVKLPCECGERRVKVRITMDQV
jgi:hypothetical protein